MQNWITDGDAFLSHLMERNTAFFCMGRSRVVLSPQEAWSLLEGRGPLHEVLST